nr:hypothetical protein GCM10023233_00040 [Brevibacterium otitidis]BFF08570.1 hypothetical protein GCM10023233_35390 [Brevibacterium otitidis]
MWRIAVYRRWLVLDTSSAFGEAIKTFVFPMLALIATGDPAAAGVVGATGTVILAISDLIGGNLADRFSKLRLLTLIAVSGCVLGVAWWVCMMLGAGTHTWLLLFFTALYSIRYGLTGSASTGLLVELLDEGHVGPALAANQGRDATISLTGAPLGGLILGFATLLAAPVLLLLDLIAVVAALRLRGKRCDADAVARDGEALADSGAGSVGEQADGDHEADSDVDDGPAEPAGFFTQSIAGFRWIAARTDVLGGLAAAVLLSMGLGVAITTQLYSLQQQGYPVSLIGVVSSAMGAGMLLGSTFAGRLMTRFRGGILVLVCGLVMLVCLALLAWFDTPWQIMLLIGIFALGIPVFNAVMMGYVLLAVPPALLGRVNSAASVINLGAAALPPLIVGFLLARWGRTSLVLLATGLLGLAVIVIAANTALRGIPRTDDWKSYADAFGT